MNYIDLIQYKYILWYQCDDGGYLPIGLNSLDDLPQAVKNTYGSDFLITEKIEVKIERK